MDYKKEILNIIKVSIYCYPLIYVIVSLFHLQYWYIGKYGSSRAGPGYFTMEVLNWLISNLAFHLLLNLIITPTVVSLSILAINVIAKNNESPVEQKKDEEDAAESN